MEQIYINAKHLIHSDTTEQLTGKSLLSNELVFDKTKRQFKINYNNTPTLFENLNYIQTGISQTDADNRYLKLTGGSLTGNLNLYNNSRLFTGNFTDITISGNIEEIEDSRYYVTGTISPLSAYPFSRQWHIMSGFPNSSNNIEATTEYSEDGTTWISDTSVNMRLLFGLNEQVVNNILTNTIKKRRFVFSQGGLISLAYSLVNWIEIHRHSGIKSNFIFTLETQAPNSDTWVVHKKITLNSPSADPYAFWIPISSLLNVNKLRFTFEQADNANPTALSLCAINLWTRRDGSQGKGRYAELPFSYDVDKNITMTGNLEVGGQDRYIYVNKFYNMRVENGYFKTNNTISHIVNKTDITCTPFPHQWHVVEAYATSEDFLDEQISTDGTTWSTPSSLSNLSILFDQLYTTKIDNFLTNTIIGHRFTFCPKSSSGSLTLGSASPVWIQISKPYTNNKLNLTIKIERSTDNVTWIIENTAKVSSSYSSSVWWIPISSSANYIRITFSHTTTPSSTEAGKVNLSQINFWSLRIGEQGQDWHSRLPFNWTTNRQITFYNNIYPSANNTLSLGNSSNYWNASYITYMNANTLYATNIHSKSTDTSLNIGTNSTANKRTILYGTGSSIADNCILSLAGNTTFTTGNNVGKFIFKHGASSEIRHTDIFDNKIINYSGIGELGSTTQAWNNIYLNNSIYSNKIKVSYNSTKEAIEFISI